MRKAVGKATHTQGTAAAESAADNHPLEFQDALEMLQKTQASLVQSEKMAAIGQLVSGLSHEINTPLGTINSSVGNMSSTLEQLCATMQESLKALREEEFVLFPRLLEQAGRINLPMGSREERAARHRLKQALITLDPHYRDQIADILGDLGVYDAAVLDGMPISENTVRILELTLKLVILSRGVEAVRTATALISGVISALRNLSHPETTGPLKPYDLTEGIEMTLMLFGSRIWRGVRLVRRYDPIPLVECNPDEMNQVWINLISNALQAMELEGVLTVEIARRNGLIRVTIGDTGSGIADAIKDRVFEPFFTTRPAGEGTGLGLNIVRRIIAKHHGTIAFESIPGETRFVVEIPAEQG